MWFYEKNTFRFHAFELIKYNTICVYDNDADFIAGLQYPVACE